MNKNKARQYLDVITAPDAFFGPPTPLEGERPGGNPSERALRGWWKRHGVRVTRNYIARRPGRRPELWWKFSAPAGRMVVPGKRRKSQQESAALQRVADLGFLFLHKLVSSEEEAALEAQYARERLMFRDVVRDESED
jgi:hypothetical protein